MYYKYSVFNYFPQQLSVILQIRDQFDKGIFIKQPAFRMMKSCKSSLFDLTFSIF